MGVEDYPPDICSDIVRNKNPILVCHIMDITIMMDRMEAILADQTEIQNIFNCWQM